MLQIRLLVRLQQWWYRWLQRQPLFPLWRLLKRGYIIAIGQFIEAINRKSLVSISLLYAKYLFFTAYISSPADKKQLLMVSGAYQILKEKSDSGMIDAEVMDK